MKLILLFLLYNGLIINLHAASYKVEKSPAPGRVEKTAAGDLEKYLKDAVKDDIFIDNKNNVIFYVGKTPFASEHGIDADKLEEGEWIIKSFGNKVVLAGGGFHGTLYAVYVFLEKFAGMRYWNTREKFIPKHTVLKLKSLDLHGKPAFAMRDLNNSSYIISDVGKFALFNRLNRYGAIAFAYDFGGEYRYGKPYFVHTFNFYFPKDKYFKTHPEYFASLEGKRTAGPKSQLCLSNEEVINQTIKKLKEYILSDEAGAKKAGVMPPQIYDISANDNGRICGCEKCQAIIKKEAADAGLIIHFINRVAEELKKFRPNLMLSTLAYINTEVPPKSLRPLDNVVIRLCNTSLNNIGSIYSPSNKIFTDKVKDWVKICKNLYIWEYAITYMGADMPYPSEFYYQNRFKFYRDNGMKFMFIELEKPESSDMHTYKSYLMAKLLENPDADVDKIRTDFMKGYYGAAGNYMAKYRDILLDSSLKHNSFVVGYIPISGTYNFLDLNTVLESRKLFDLAEKAVANDPVLLKRVKRARLNLDRAAYVLYRKLTGEWLNTGRKLEDFPLKLNELIERAKKTWQEAIETCYAEKHRAKPTKLMDKELKLYTMLPATVPAAKRFKDKAKQQGYIDFTAELSNPNNNEIVLDKESETGYAVKVDASKKLRPHYCLPFRYGAYRTDIGKSMYTGVFGGDAIPRAGYNWYRCKEFIPTVSGYLYFTGAWTISFTQDLAASMNKTGKTNKKYEAWISVKFTGPDFPHSRPGEQNAIYIDRCVMFPVQDKK